MLISGYVGAVLAPYSAPFAVSFEHHAKTDYPGIGQDFAFIATPEQPM